MFVMGTTVGTTADINGEFNLSVPKDSKTLVFSFVGMKTEEMLIGTKTTFNARITVYGWSIERAISEPPGAWKYRK